MAKPKRSDDGVDVIGAAGHPLRDAYHTLLTVRLSGLLGIIVLAFLGLNALFATAYVLTGGIEGARPGSFVDAFFFSSQTLGTIGYGAMHPLGTAANLVAVVESLVSILFIALTTGIVFARFSRSTESLVFSDRPCISPMDGIPTLVLRIGNDRDGAVMDAQVRMTMFRTHRTEEGVTMYRMTDLVLTRDRTPALGRTFTVMHPIQAGSPLFGSTPSSWEKDEIEILVNVVGTDGTSLQPVHGRRRYTTDEVLWGARPVDVLTERPDGRIELDVRKFHDVVPTPATAAFPYSLVDHRTRQ